MDENKKLNIIILMFLEPQVRKTAAIKRGVMNDCLLKYCFVPCIFTYTQLLQENYINVLTKTAKARVY